MSETLHSLTDLIERASSRRFLEVTPPEDLGLADHQAFPFLALVGQTEMKLALLLTLINPKIDGVLLIGPRGTGKTTAVRGLVDLLPEVPRSRCPYGCLPEDIEIGGQDAVCPDCARKYGEGESLIYLDRVRFIELPLNAKIENVVGGLDERAAIHNRLRLNRGILARAHRNLLYVDEVNLLSDDIVNAILDAAAQGSYTVQRGPLSATYRSRFVLIGSMNPEEGQLRPQIFDRFGLRVVVRGLDNSLERMQAYRCSIAYRTNPRQFIQVYAEMTQKAQEEIQTARDLLPDVTITPQAEDAGLRMIHQLQIASLRAEITLFEAARAYAVADSRTEVQPEDVNAVAQMALRQRRSSFMQGYFENQSREEDELQNIIRSSNNLTVEKKGRTRRSSKSKTKKPTKASHADNSKTS